MALEMAREPALCQLYRHSFVLCGIAARVALVDRLCLDRLAALSANMTSSTKPEVHNGLRVVKVTGY